MHPEENDLHITIYLGRQFSASNGCEWFAKLWYNTKQIFLTLQHFHFPDFTIFFKTYLQCRTSDFSDQWNTLLNKIITHRFRQVLQGKTAAFYLFLRPHHLLMKLVNVPRRWESRREQAQASDEPAAGPEHAPPHFSTPNPNSCNGKFV